MLKGLLQCVCGQRIRTDGTMGTPPRQRKMHPHHEACPEWGPKASYGSDTYEPWIVGQVTGIQIDDATVERIVRVLATPGAKPSNANRARVERMKRELALDHAAGRLADATYLARMTTLRTELASVAEDEPMHVVASADKVGGRIRVREAGQGTRPAWEPPIWTVSHNL